MIKNYKELCEQINNEFNKIKDPSLKDLSQPYSRVSVIRVNGA
jgi:hypothetical protein